MLLINNPVICKTKQLNITLINSISISEIPVKLPVAPDFLLVSSSKNKLRLMVINRLRSWHFNSCTLFGLIQKLLGCCFLHELFFLYVSANRKGKFSLLLTGAASQ